jgi:hypothetical protein
MLKPGKKSLCMFILSQTECEDEPNSSAMLRKSQFRQNVLMKMTIQHHSYQSKSKTLSSSPMEPVRQTRLITRKTLSKQFLQSIHSLHKLILQAWVAQVNPNITKSKSKTIWREIQTNRICLELWSRTSIKSLIILLSQCNLLSLRKIIRVITSTLSLSHRNNCCRKQ